MKQKTVRFLSRPLEINRSVATTMETLERPTDRPTHRVLRYPPVIIYLHRPRPTSPQVALQTSRTNPPESRGASQ